jgi:hypothetical protein
MCRSLTAAQRFVRTLDRAGIAASAIRSPVASPNGCGWCVRVGENRLTDALSALELQKLRPVKIYMMYPNGEYTEVAL